MTTRWPARLGLFLAATFGITWACWWSLAVLVERGVTRAGEGPYLAAYVLGGLGPTIAAYLAVVATAREGPLREFHGRLLRWRVGVGWYAAALGLPLGLVLGAGWIGAALEPGLAGQAAPEPWPRLLALFPLMILGGGLEELGWRGVAQPELERRLARLPAALLVGAAWAAWHLPLFVLAGAPQHGQDFAVFALEVLGSALLLAWLQAGTGSILLCVLFHAAQNTFASMGYGATAGQAGVRLGAALVRLALGAALLLASGRSPRPVR